MLPSRHIGPLIPWACTLRRNGVPFGITLYATDPDQIERDHPGIRVDGRLISTSLTSQVLSRSRPRR